MIEVDIKEMKKNKIKLTKAVKELEENNLNFYNELKVSNDYWQDEISPYFYDDVLKEKQSVELFLNELNDYGKNLQNMMNNYEVMGEHIICDLESKDEVIDKIDKMFSTLEEVKKELWNIEELYFDQFERQLYVNEVEDIKDLGKILTEIKNNLKSFFEEVLKIEQDSFELLNKQSHVILQTKDISTFF